MIEVERLSSMKTERLKDFANIRLSGCPVPLCQYCPFECESFDGYSCALVVAEMIVQRREQICKGCDKS